MGVCTIPRDRRKHMRIDTTIITGERDIQDSPVRTMRRKCRRFYTTPYQYCRGYGEHVSRRLSDGNLARAPKVDEPHASNSTIRINFHDDILIMHITVRNAFETECVHCGAQTLCDIRFIH
jgi:hypothetical protein